MECKEHAEHVYRLQLSENRITELEDKINKQSGKVEQAYLKAELVVIKADKLMDRVDDMLLKSVQLEEKVENHLNESGFWRGFMGTLAIMILAQFIAFVYAWGAINNTVQENYKKIERFHAYVSPK